MSHVKPEINVTPLIDILLVLLIVFMIISPIKASKFETKIPSESKGQPNPETPPNTLIVKINSDNSLDINSTKGFGTINSPDKLIKKLNAVFVERTENNVVAFNKENSPANQSIEKTVFIKAPRSLGYGEVVKVVDALKIAGASPISLQIDDLD